MPLNESDREWISKVASEIEQKLSAKLNQELAMVRVDMKQFATKEDLRNFETRMLTEFHKWASPTVKPPKFFDNLRCRRRLTILKSNGE